MPEYPHSSFAEWFASRKNYYKARHYNRFVVAGDIENMLEVSEAFDNGELEWEEVEYLNEWLWPDGIDTLTGALKALTGGNALLSEEDVADLWLQWMRYQDRSIAAYRASHLKAEV